MKKNKKEEPNLEVKLKQQLNNFNPSEVEAYLLALLRKCLEATAKKDYLTLGNVEDILNKSIIILASKVKNFNLMYSNLKLKVATEYLAKYIEVDNAEAFNFLNVLPEFVTLEEANLIAEVEDFKNYGYSKRSILANSYSEILGNDKYTIIVEGGDSITVLEKGTDNKICFESWEGNLEIFEGFINNRTELKPNETLEVISIMQDEKLSERSVKIEKLYTYCTEFFRNNEWFNFEEDNILYFKENDNYLAVITDEFLIIIFDKNTGKYNTFVNNTWHIKDFLFSFLDYCLGIDTEEVLVPDVNVNEVYNVYFNVLAYSTWNFKELLEYYEKNPSKELYRVLNSHYLFIRSKIKLMKYLINKPYISDNVEPEVIKSINNLLVEYNSISSKMLDMAKQHNREMQQEDREFRKQQQEIIESYGSIANYLNYWNL